MYRKWLREYFSFTRKERNAVVVLLSLVIVIGVLPYLVPAKKSAIDQETLDQFQRDIALLKPVGRDTQSVHQYKSSSYPSENKFYGTGSHAAASLFPFDPNTLQEEGWIKLGVPERTARTIMHYREKGGKFRKPEDIAKIYSLPKEVADRLLPFVRLPVADKPPAPLPAPAFTHDAASSPRSSYKDLLIDVNQTDSATLEMLPGIGGRLAARILNFREKLGGFYSVDQVAETYGLPDSTFQRIKPHLKVSAQAVTILDINTATADQLRMHPYIRWNIANAIEQFRRQHGNFTKPADLLQIPAITPALFARIEPYLKTE